jgi:hypothetical protein
MDWSGVFLLNSGLLLLLVGISIGGEHPWGSATVLAPLIIGIAELLAFWIWEWKGSTNPFMARELFTKQQRKFVMFLIVDFVAGMGLYAAAAFWAQLVRGDSCTDLWGVALTLIGIWQGDPIEVGMLSLPGGLGGASLYSHTLSNYFDDGSVGGFGAGMLIGRGGFFRTNLCLVYGTVIKTIADYCLVLIQPSGKFSKGFGMGIGFLSMFGTGWTSVSLIVCVQLACADEDIGMATLILGAVRAVGGSVAITVYSTIINRVLKEDAGVNIAKAVLPLGYPESGLESLVVELINENVEVARALPDMTNLILDAAREALKTTWTKAFHQLYLAAASFSAVSIVAAFLSKDVSSNMTNHVAVRLTNEQSKVHHEESHK